MSQIINASLKMTDLYDMFTKGHTAFQRGKTDQKLYCNVTIWLNDQPDQFGKILSITLNSAKDCAPKDAHLIPAGKKQIYVGSGILSGGSAAPLAGGNEMAGFGGGNAASVPLNQQRNPMDAFGGDPGSDLPF